MLLQTGDKVGITGCSNPYPQAEKQKNEAFFTLLKNIGLIPVISPFLYENAPGTPREKARILNSLYGDTSIKAIFDISGGDLANEVVDYLDYAVIKKNPKPFWGYSDLTCIINAIYTRCQHPSYLYQMKFLTKQHQALQQKRFVSSIFYGKNELYDLRYHFLQGNTMEGTVIGGNIRCFLKLAGTPYFPDFRDKILVLESLGGDPPRIRALLAQLRQTNAFARINGILLGNFTELDSSHPGLKERLLLDALGDFPVPVAVTPDIGHNTDAKCILIGRHMVF